jgi:hypothetical protein
MLPEHFPMNNWFELALGIVSPEQQELMQDDLSNACGGRGSAKAWSGAFDAGRGEARFPAPARTVQPVKPSLREQKRLQRRPESVEVVSLVFDSSKRASTNPVRNLSVSSRHLLHETESFVIDLRLEEDPARKRVRLTGQILNSKEPSRQIERPYVTLLSGEALAAEAAVGPSGEFDLEFGKEEGLELFVDIRGHSAIWIALPSLGSPNRK